MSFELPQTFFVLLVRVHLQTTGNLYRDNYNECKAGNGLLTEWFQGLEKQARASRSDSKNTRTIPQTPPQPCLAVEREETQLCLISSFLSRGRASLEKSRSPRMELWGCGVGALGLAPPCGGEEHAAQGLEWTSLPTTMGDREMVTPVSERLGNLVELPGKNLVTFRPVINQMPKNSSLYSSVLCIIDGYICLCNE